MVLYSAACGGVQYNVIWVTGAAMVVYNLMLLYILSCPDLLLSIHSPVHSREAEVGRGVGHWHLNLGDWTRIGLFL